MQTNLVQQKREDFRNDIRQRRNEQLFRRKRMSGIQSSTDELLTILQDINIIDEESALNVIEQGIPQKIIEILFQSDVTLPYTVELFKSKRHLIMEALYIFNSLTANSTQLQLEQNIPQSFVSYLVQLFTNFNEIITSHPDLIYVVDFLDCIFYNLLMTDFQISVKDKVIISQAIQKSILSQNFTHLTLQGQETMLALYCKLFIEYDTQSLSICSVILQNYKKKELLILVVKFMIKALHSTSKQSRRYLQNLLTFFRQQDFSGQVLLLLDEFPNIVIEYFRHISNYQKSICSQLIDYKQSYIIFENWQKFERKNLYYFLACIITTYKIIIGDILQNKLLLDQIFMDISTQFNQESKDAYYLLCYMMKEDENLSQNYSFIEIINNRFINSISIEEQKAYLELIQQYPQFVLVNCPNKIKAKIESLITIPELETLVKRSLD